MSGPDDGACLIRTITYSLAPVISQGCVIGSTLIREADGTDPGHASCPDTECPTRACVIVAGPESP